MKKLLFLLVTLVSFNFTLEETPLTADERKKAEDILKQSREAFLKSVKGLKPAQLNFKSTPTSWSIAECAEHIAISENNIFGMVDGALKVPADASKRSEIKISDEDVVKKMTDRSWKVKTGEAFEPKNTFGGFEGSVKEFTAKRDSHVAFVNSTKDDLRDRVQQTPMGAMDTYQVILFMAAHSQRHTAQIEEVKTDPNYPK